MAALGSDEGELLRVAASLEQNSEHPLARSIVDLAKEAGITLSPVTDFESTTGGGVMGKLDGKTVRVGKRKFLEESGVGIPEDLDREAQHLQEKAQTVVWVAVHENTAGLLSIADPIKQTTPKGLEIGVLYENASRSLCAGSSSPESFWLDKLGSPQPWR
ncbi:MAG: hypothetical protein ABW214_00840 [Terrimicrobiaceae bacterium]